MEVDWTHLAVVGGWMMFCEAIPLVVFAGLPINLGILRIPLCRLLLPVASSPLPEGWLQVVAG